MILWRTRSEAFILHSVAGFAKAIVLYCEPPIHMIGGFENSCMRLRLIIVMGLIFFICSFRTEAQSICPNRGPYSQKGWFNCKRDKRASDMINCSVEKSALKKIFGDDSHEIGFSGWCFAKFSYLSNVDEATTMKRALKGETQDRYISVDYNSGTGCIKYSRVLFMEGTAEYVGINKFGEIKRLPSISQDNYEIMRFHCNKK